MSILVCGGAGYIGSHTTLQLVEQGLDVVVVDSLITGHREAVDKRAKLEIGDIRDKEFLSNVFEKYNIEGVIHFAAFSLVGESMEKPLKYFENNVNGTMCLLETMNKYNVKSIVFSSTAATYGEAENIPILENSNTIPTNAYGESKLMVETILKWCDTAYGIKHVVLRYFNVAGADKSGKIGEAHTTETHLIPLVLAVPLGKRDEISIFGNDYNTEDGTCIRDYIHVTDLSDAHILAINKLLNGGESATYNLGSGKGFSVKEIIEVAQNVVGKEIKSVVKGRRAGDPPILIASSDKIMKELNWKRNFDSLDSIIASAWKWHSNNPNGYNK